jgi:hypothetical protein
MGISNLVAAASGLSSAIKSLQSGSASTAGTITITSVNTSKTLVTSFPTGAAGTVAATGAVNAANGSNSSFSGANSQSALFPAYPGNGQITNSTAQYGSNNAYNPLNGGLGSMTYLGGGAYTVSMMPAYGTNMNGSNIGLNATNITGGSTNLYAASYGAYLTNSTTLTVTGPCQWQVVEYN